MFGFGDYDKSSPKLLLKKDIKVLNQAPSSNMSAERLVGSVNYELGVGVCKTQYAVRRKAGGHIA